MTGQRRHFLECRQAFPYIAAHLQQQKVLVKAHSPQVTGCRAANRSQVSGWGGMWARKPSHRETIQVLESHEPRV